MKVITEHEFNDLAQQLVKLFAIPCVNKRFLVTYGFINRTDCALHEDEIDAANCVEACNKVCENHNYEVEWHTVKEKTVC